MKDDDGFGPLGIDVDVIGADSFYIEVHKFDYICLQGCQA